MLPPSAATATATAASGSSDSAKMNRGGIGGGGGVASRSVESFIEAVPPVTNGTLLGGGGDYGDELSIGCGRERFSFRNVCSL